jgi:O-antigen ligase
MRAGIAGGGSAARRDAPLVPLGLARPAAATASVKSDRWVQRLSIVVLVLTELYVIFGVPGEERADTSVTDRVSPLNSWIWLSLLAMALPVLKQRWRQVLALIFGCWPLLMLYGYFALSVTWALDPSASLRRVLFTVVQLIIFSILLTGIKRAPVAHITIFAACAAGAVADLITWVVAPGYAMSDEGFAGLQSQKNVTGLLMMYGILAGAPCFFIVRGWFWRLTTAALTLMMALLLIATRSTTSQSVVLSASVVMPAILVVAQLPRRLILAIAGTTLLVITGAALCYLMWCGVTGVDPMLPLKGATFSARTDLWTFVIGQIKQRPWLGAGYSSLWSIDPAVQPSLKTDQWFGVYSIINEGHDGYLDQWATGGIVGLVGSLFVVFRAIVLAGRALNWSQKAPPEWQEALMTRPTAMFHLSLLLGLLVHNFTESNLFNNNSVLAVAFLICLLDLEKWRVTIRRTGQHIDVRQIRHLPNQFRIR